MKDDECFSPEEIALLSPTIGRIVQKFERLSPTNQIDIIGMILSAVTRQHRIDDSLDLVLFTFGQGVEQERKFAA